MRCHFMRYGRIAAVEVLDVKSDEEAIEKSKALFEDRKSQFEGFEVWDRARVVARHPHASAPNTAAVWPPYKST